MDRSLKKKYWADQAKKSVLLIPALVLLLAFFIIPIVLTVYYSFTNMALTGAAAQNFQFIGLENCKYQKHIYLPDRKPCRPVCSRLFDCIFHEGKGKSFQKRCWSMYPGRMGYAGDRCFSLLSGIL